MGKYVPEQILFSHTFDAMNIDELIYKLKHSVKNQEAGILSGPHILFISTYTVNTVTRWDPAFLSILHNKAL